MCLDIYQMVAKNRIPNRSSFASHPLHATVPLNKIMFTVSISPVMCVKNASPLRVHSKQTSASTGTGTLFLFIFSSFLLFFIEALVAQWLHAWDSGVDDLQYRFDIR